MAFTPRFYRLKLDIPHQYAVEQGVLKSRYAQDFTDTPGGMVDTWRCPVTGVMMLTPSFRSRSFADDFKGLNNWTRKVVAIDHWRGISKSIDAFSMLSNMRPAGGTKFFAPLDPNIAAAAIFNVNASTSFYDELEWALVSNFQIGIDEAFCIHYRGLTDELLRKNNWMAIQWDDCYIHLSHQGHVTVCQYADRGDISAAPSVWHEFDIADPGDLLGKNGQMVFLPMPGRGLLMYHLLGGNKQNAFASNTGSFALKGSHLIPWPSRHIGNHDRMFEASQVRIALNPYHAHNFGFSNVTFAASGNYLEEKFDPGYKPSLDPVDVGALTLAHFGANFSTIAIDLRKADNSGLWTAGTDRQGRVKIFLTTSDSRYTPFVYGWGVQWMPVFQTRDSIPVTIYDGTIEGEEEDTYLAGDVWRRIEITDDSNGNVEGTADLKIETALACKIVERGDSTWQLEYSEDEEDDEAWTIYYGGLCKFEPPVMQYHPDWGMFLLVRARLHGQEERFEEIPNTLGTAFDSGTLATCFNLVLNTSGFNAIADEDFPAAFLNIRIPPLAQGSNWRFHPRFGDTYKHIIALLMFLSRTQNNEYKRIYDWENGVWTVVRRPHGEEEDGENLNWRLTYNQDEEDHENQIGFYCEEMRVEYQPVEATSFQVLGVVQEGEGQPAVYPSGEIRHDSAITDYEIDDEFNFEYTGRMKGARFVVPGCGSIELANEIARKVNPRFFHRNILPILMIPPGHANLDLKPDIEVTWVLPPRRGEEDDRETVVYIKRRTLIIDVENHGPQRGDANEQMVLACDKIWEQPWKEE
jgi:hypothetical protein